MSETIAETAKFGPALLIALGIDDESAAYLERLRRRYFPPERNRVPAHVMLFHRLPLANRHAYEADVRALANTVGPFELHLEQPYSLGRGVALHVISQTLVDVRASLAQRWRDVLVPQDRESYRPHAVVQNKVDAQTARATLTELRASLTSRTARATGLVLWTYRSGDWIEPCHVAFEPESPVPSSKTPST